MNSKFQVFENASNFIFVNHILMEQSGAKNNIQQKQKSKYHICPILTMP